MNRRKHKRLGPVLFAAVLFAGSLGRPGFCAQAAQWGKDEKGRNWRYYYSPDEYAKNEWIRYEGKEYYVDSSGNLKTKSWVKNPDGGRCYVGEDGAKVYNTFTPDGKYVGPGGTVLTEYDNYRKAVKKQLQSALKGKGYRELSAGMTPEFVYADLNGDRYKDVAVLCGEIVEGGTSDQEIAAAKAAKKQLLMIAVWDPEGKTFVLSAEGDVNTPGNFRLSRNVRDGSIWLRIQDEDENETVNYFRLEDSSARFESQYSFSTKKNDWGDTRYYVNDEKVKKGEWDEYLKEAEDDAGEELTGYAVLTEEAINAAVDQVPADGDLDLWEEE
ncbi:MAG: hypothetical protein HFE83_11355 [Lachnospiraceae bacterium]|nr:hypothetical protein [Lachnospiraceae bacterium]